MMNGWLMLACYAGMGAALAWLRWRQGDTIGDAAFQGLFWPAEILRGWLELAAYLRDGREETANNEPSVPLHDLVRAGVATQGGGCTT